ncbi:SMI1/KNR4 family protein [Methylobacterium trifolii]|uniref:Knr4/Smi1-like domain-containing protein n=1 Tax=Methylobacterium trifolii TaxID=1003092 RepID=A0ABQ4U4W5_9HYPH|nr:SMI1/KNR4 family protein [Methylobacterium trifolii]GJE60845.1 hypothetical protein MPOCJGCO_2963 [Methylobacterium trifolii]
MWSAVFASLRQGSVSAEAEIARAEAELGFALPESYRSFCRDCGAGLACGHWRIATPTPFEGSDLVTRAGLIAHSVNDAIRLMGEAPELSASPHAFAIEGDDPTIVERACFFGTGEDGSFLFWDVTGTGEYDVWVMDPDLETVRFGGETLLDLMRRVQGASVTTVLGFGAEPLPSTFEGIDAAVLARADPLA